MGLDARYRGHIMKIRKSNWKDFVVEWDMRNIPFICLFSEVSSAKIHS